MLPHDPVMLLSVIITKLRDEYGSLDELCRALDEPKDELCTKLAAIDYHYSPEKNHFI